MGSNDQTSRMILMFVMVAFALAMFIIASQVGMPLRAIVLALAISDIIFLLLLVAGKLIPDRTGKK